MPTPAHKSGSGDRFTLEQDSFLGAYASLGCNFLASHDLGFEWGVGARRYRYLRKIGWWKRLRTLPMEAIDREAYAREVAPDGHCEKP